MVVFQIPRFFFTSKVIPRISNYVITGIYSAALFHIDKFCYVCFSSEASRVRGEIYAFPQIISIFILSYFLFLESCLGVR